jgi:putative oxidoreductase
MKKYLGLATLLLRYSLAAGFLSAVASRLGLWGAHSSGWEHYLAYVAQVNSFAPAGIIPFLAVASTVLETGFGILLIIGYKTRWAALGSCVLSLLFILTMTYSFGIKEPLDYSVFAFSAGAFLLACMSDYRWSLDERAGRK